MRVKSVAREIIVGHPEALSDCISGPVISGAERTAGRGAVVKLGPPGGAPLAILKIATTPQGKRLLRHETEVLRALHADQRLDGLRELIPQPLANGLQRGRSYRLDSALGGRSVAAPSAAVSRTLLGAAVETITALHNRTATTVAAGPDLAERWVDAPLRELVRHPSRSRWRTYRLEQLRAELHGAVGTGTLTVGWIHGDYWLGNLLFSGDRSVSGIIDWDAASPLELPFHDLLHLLLYTRRLITGHELGELVCDQLQGQAWRADERALLRDHWPRRSACCLSERHILLLYWLRHAALHASQQGATLGYRYRSWERRNVLPVLAALVKA